MSDPGSGLTWSNILTAADKAEATPPMREPVAAAELAAILAGRMCHDFISPASAIVSGVDLLDDPSAQDMRDDAMKLIETSAKKLVGLLAFSRVAFGGSSTAENFDPRELQRLTQGIYDHVRPSLDWAVSLDSVTKPCARALLNLAQIASSVLPAGGVAKVTAVRQGDEVLMSVEASGARVRLRPEVIRGLEGQALGEGLSGHWVQAYYLYALLKAAGGALDHHIEPERVTLRARCPADV